jgi:hypothetical protein
MRLLEMLSDRFGAFETIAYASVEMARKGARRTPMERMTAEAILEFGDDLRQAYEAALQWSDARALTDVCAGEPGVLNSDGERR